MQPSLPLEFSGAYYHLMARGDRREAIFHDDDDRRFFLATLSDACAVTGWRVHVWVLMGNHYHLFIETRSQPGGVAPLNLVRRPSASAAVRPSRLEFQFPARTSGSPA